jgi:hypothetical protein
VYATHTLKRIIVRTLLSGSVAAAGFGLTAGTAQADPGCPESPYFCWCPGKPLPKTSDAITWDMSACHNFHYTTFGGYGTLFSPPPGYCPPRLLSDNWYDRC